MNITEEQLAAFIHELIKQVDEGRKPTADGVAAAVGIEIEDGRALIAGFAAKDYLAGLGTNEAAVVRVTSVSAELRNLSS